MLSRRLSNLTSSERIAISREGRIANSKLDCVHIDDGNVFIPLDMAINVLKFSPRPIDDFSGRKLAFEGTLRDKQRTIKSQLIKHLLSNYTAIVQSGCGFGKTALAIYVASLIPVQRLILVDRVVLIEQWVEAIQQFCPTATIEIDMRRPGSSARLKGLNVVQNSSTADFIVANIHSLGKWTRDELRNVGYVVLDECHLLLTAKNVSNLSMIEPRFLVGLSATPYRIDDTNEFFRVFLGGVRKAIGSLHPCPHTVFVVRTGIEIGFTHYGYSERVDWTAVIDSQAYNIKRNMMIVDIVRRHIGRTHLILVKRVKHAQILCDMLKSVYNDDTLIGTLVGKQQTFSATTCRVLVAIVKKGGVAFNWPQVDTLILAADVQAYYIQVIGRLMRGAEAPIVFDLVDNNCVLQKHFDSRVQTYRELGGSFVNYVC